MLRVVRKPFPSCLPFIYIYPTLAHRWLYDVAGILHCDLSPDNIMCQWIDGTNANREQEKQAYGVLTDYDLLSWVKDLKEGYCQGYSLRLTGTSGLVGKGGVEGVFEAFRG